MRKMFVVAAILAATTAQAAEELKFGDVNYFLKQGQMNLAADFKSTFERIRNKGGSNYETRGLVTDAAFGYAFTDRLNAYVGVSYAYDLETEDKTTAANADVYNDGFSNPSVGINYRFMNQNESRYNLDFGVVARFGIEDAERGYSVGQNSKDSNFASGRDTLELNARLGRKWNEANEWQLAVGAVYANDGEYTQKSQTGNVTVDEESSLDYFVRATYQYRPVNEFMMLVSAQANYIGEFDREASNATTTFDDHVDIDFRFTAKYLITENFIGRFHYGMSRNEDIDTKTGATKGQIEKRRENFYGLGVDFLF